jgi:hypothetical protein
MVNFHHFLTVLRNEVQFKYTEAYGKVQHPIQQKCLHCSLYGHAINYSYTIISSTFLSTEGSVQYVRAMQQSIWDLQKEKLCYGAFF